jgi:hypothetical protein
MRTEEPTILAYFTVSHKPGLRQQKTNTVAAVLFTPELRKEKQKQSFFFKPTTFATIKFLALTHPPHPGVKSW